jgi:hypothetical protein
MAVVGMGMAVAILGVVLVAGGGAKDYPSRFLPLDGKFDTLAFILRPERDLRWVFCNPATVVDRSRRGVCAVDYAFGRDPFEAKVEEGQPLSRLLEAIGKKRWHGGQRQIRVITRNAIYQSPSGPPIRSEIESFLGTKIAPGDIVVFVYVE